MSNNFKKDYARVFKAVKSLLPSIIVKIVTVDFEAAIWVALSAILPGVTILGCYFQRVQAIWRRVQELGLQAGYSNDAVPVSSSRFHTIKAPCISHTTITHHHTL